MGTSLKYIAIFKLMGCYVEMQGFEFCSFVHFTFGDTLVELQLIMRSGARVILLEVKKVIYLTWDLINSKKCILATFRRDIFKYLVVQVCKPNAASRREGKLVIKEDKASSCSNHFTYSSQRIRISPLISLR